MSILIVSGIEGISEIAAVAAKQLGVRVDIAAGRRAALHALRRTEFAIVVVDESVAECDPAAADAIWEQSGLAIPLQVNFALCDVTRMIREIRSALHRREREQAASEKAARMTVEGELRRPLTGLLLHSELALAQDGVPPGVAEKLRLIASLACTLREHLGGSSQPPIAEVIAERH